MIARQNIVKRKLRSLALWVFAYLENSGTADFDTNGEKQFIEDLFGHLRRVDQGNVVFFDIGANIGEYTQMLLEKAYSLKDAVEIHVFEPTQSCFKVITSKYRDVKEVILNNKAVSNSNGTAEIFYDALESTFASLHKRNLDAYSINMNRSEIVETIRLDAYVEKKGINHIHFLKIDIEGHEMAAFEGLGSYLNGDFIDFVQFEYGGANLDSHTSLMELYALFEKAGFVMTKVMRNGLDIRPYKPWMENFQYANYVAISRKIVDGLR